MDLKHRLKVFGKAIYETNLEIMSFVWMLCIYIITAALIGLPLMLIWKYDLWNNVYTWVIYVIWVLYALMVKTKYNRMRD